MIKTVLYALLVALLISGCSSRGVPSVSPSVDNSNVYETPDGSAHSHPTMRAYTIRGVRYYPTVVRKGDIFDGKASWYGPNFHGKLTSNGETYNMYDDTAAHKTLPMNTVVKVTNLNNKRHTIVRINDRGPFVASRIIDLSKKAAEDIGMLKDGTAPVRVEVLGFAQKGSRSVPDSATLIASDEQQVIDALYIQIGSFSRYEGALLTQKKYDNLDGYTTIVRDTERDGKRLFRVWLGEFESEDEARDFISSSPFHDAFIVRR